MESLGEFLRKAREQKGLTQEDISARTRINPNYVKAIEIDDYSKIPADIYARGFLRLYAKTVSISEEEVFERFKEVEERFYSDNKGVDEIVRRKDERIGGNKGKNKRFLILSISTFLLLSFWLLFYLLKEEPKTLPPAIEQNETKELSKEEMATEGEEEGKEADEVPVQGEKHTESVISEKPEQIELTLNATDRTWIDINIDDAEKKEYLLNTGDNISFKANDKFIITIGNAGGVKAWLNGELLSSFGEMGQVKRDILLSKGEKTSD